MGKHPDQVVIINSLPAAGSGEKPADYGNPSQVVIVNSLPSSSRGGASCSAIAVSLFVLIVGIGVMLALVAGAIW